MSATWYSDEQKHETDEKVLAALANGPLAASQIGKTAGVSDAGVWHSLKRLIAEGYVRETGQKVRTSERGTLGMTYEKIGQPRDVTQNVVKQWNSKPFRDWRDTALFGDYVPAKNRASTRAEAA
jgi:predicted transcriptional regulator